MASLPRQIRYIVAMEACERFSYYGMLSILLLYLKNQLGMPEARSKEVMHLFSTAVYLLPLVGGWLADRWIGRYRTIVYLSLFYCLGHGVLALFEGKPVGVLSGLALIALGAGGIKPCISAFVGDQFEGEEDDRLRKVYSWFYWTINLGAFFGFALIPWMREHYGYSWAFGIPGFFMALALLIFLAGKEHYRHSPVHIQSAPIPLGALLSAIRTEVQSRLSRKTVTRSDQVLPNDPQKAGTAFVRILLVFAPLPVFWALFNQVNSTWVLQGERMNPFSTFGYTVDAERIQSIGALLVLFWVPILTFWLYPTLEKLGVGLPPLQRMKAGMVLASVAFAVCAFIEQAIDERGRISLAWQVAPYTLLAAGEVMVSATALEFAYKEAPSALKSTIMSLWLLTIAGGHFLVAAITGLNARFIQASGVAEFWFYAFFLLGITVLFHWLARAYRSSPTTSAHLGPVENEVTL